MESRTGSGGLRAACVNQITRGVVPLRGGGIGPVRPSLWELDTTAELPENLTVTTAAANATNASSND